MEFLSREGVAFVEKNIRTDDQALRELIEMGVNSTPAVVIDGKVLVGFDRTLLREALK